MTNIKKLLEEKIKQIVNKIAFKLNPSNDTMIAIRLFREKIPEIEELIRADERAKILHKVKSLSGKYDTRALQKVENIIIKLKELSND